MAVRLTLAFSLSLILHFISFYSFNSHQEIKFSTGESYLVEILPGGQTKLSVPMTSNKGQATFSSVGTSIGEVKAGTGAGTGDGIGVGEGNGMQSDWMIVKPVYTEESRRNEEEGKVEVVVACKKDLGCHGTIKNSSGFKRLDQSVLRAVQKIKVSKDEIRELSFVFRLDDHP